MSNNIHPNAEEVTLLSSDIEFSGNLELEHKLEIKGFFEGKINAKGSIHLFSSAVLKADINVGSIRVEGQLQGTVKGANLVHIQPSARVKADIHCKEIQIDRKARVDGIILMEQLNK